MFLFVVLAVLDLVLLLLLCICVHYVREYMFYLCVCVWVGGIHATVSVELRTTWREELGVTSLLLF